MKKTSILTALLLVLLSTICEARVIVYKGTGRMVRGDGTVARTVPTTLFFLLDPATFEGRWVFAQNIAGAKTIFDDGSTQYGLCVDVQTPGMGSAYYATATFAFTTPGNFNCFSVRLGGKKANVVLIANQAPETVAKSMAGSYSFINGLMVVDGGVSVAIDVKRTQTFNNLNGGTGVSPAGAAGLIIAEYTAPPKNYTNAIPNP
jgi:hypothetical protein